MKKFIKHHWHGSKELTAVLITGFFLAAGVIQYALGLEYVLQLTALVIGILAAVAVLFWHASPKNKVSLVVAAFFIGVLVEVIGVNTGLLFGDYSYGSLLGLKVLGVPVIIGITWALVTISAWQITSYSSFGKIANIILAACIIVIFDLVLEQFATAFGLWIWSDGVIPLSNYITWFVVSAGLFVLYSFFSKQEKPSLYGAAALPLMMLFFWLMLVIQ